MVRRLKSFADDHDLNPPANPQRKRSGRRRFVGVLLAVGAVLALTPTVVVPLVERYISGGVGQPGRSRQMAIVDDNPFQGSAAGKPVNVNDLEMYPTNSSWLITYPSSGNATTDGQNPNSFVKFQLIRLPTALGG